MRPKLVQTAPVQTVDELWLIATGPVPKTRGRIVPIHEEASLHGVNIDGGAVVLGELGQAVLVAPEDAIEVARALAGRVEPTRFVTPEAVVEIDQTCEVTPIDDWAMHVPAATAAWILADQGDLDELARARALAPEDVTVQERIGARYLELERFDDAAAVFTAALARTSSVWQRADLRAALGTTCLRAGRIDEAVEHLRAACEVAGKHRQALAEALAAAGDPSVVLQLAKFDARVLAETAGWLSTVGKPDDAAAMLRTALAIDPELMKPVPENHWPKPPDTTWVTDPVLAKLVEVARG